MWLLALTLLFHENPASAFLALHVSIWPINIKQQIHHFYHINFLYLFFSANIKKHTLTHRSQIIPYPRIL